jgi:hypothetical protein
VRARSVGTYSAISERPLSGEPVRDDQLVWLARAMPAMVSDFAAYKHADAALRQQAYRTLTALEPLVDGYQAATTRGWFAFRPLARARIYGRAAGLELGATPAGLTLAIAGTTGTHVDDDDDAHRELGHIVLPRPIETVYGVTWSRVPMLPPSLRGEPRTLYLEAAYADVVSRPSETTVAEVIEEASRLFCEALAPSAARLSDYTAAAPARIYIGDTVRAPLALLAELLRPIVDGLVRVHTLTERVEIALRDRVVLLAAPRAPHFIATPIAPGPDDTALELPAAIAESLGVTTGAFVAVHLPLSERAQQQATRRVGAASADTDHDDDAMGPSWLEELADSDDKVGILLRVARSGELASCRTPHAALLVGGYAVTSEPRVK